MIDQVVGQPRSIRVYSPDPVPEITDHFKTAMVSVEHVPLSASAGSEFITVREGETFLGGASLDTVRKLVDPPVSEPWDEDRRASSYRELLDLLADVTFVGFDRRQMLAVSREIEDRAWRIDDGELHATFTAAEALDDQLAVYEQLATRVGLAVHVYVPDDEDLPSPSGVVVHPVDPAAIDDVWSVAYLGGDPVHATVLIGEEGGAEVSAATGTGDEPPPPGFAGVWTDDQEKVEAVIETFADLTE